MVKLLHWNLEFLKRKQRKTIVLNFRLHWLHNIISDLVPCLCSQSEIQQVLEHNVAPSRIVYANPCKQTSHIRYAAKNDVALMTFDNETELHKIKAVYPDAE